MQSPGTDERSARLFKLLPLQLGFALARGSEQWRAAPLD